MMVIFKIVIPLDMLHLIHICGVALWSSPTCITFLKRVPFCRFRRNGNLEFHSVFGWQTKQIPLESRGRVDLMNFILAFYKKIPNWLGEPISNEINKGYFSHFNWIYPFYVNDFSILWCRHMGLRTRSLWSSRYAFGNPGFPALFIYLFIF